MGIKSPRDELIDYLKKLPENVSMEDIMYHLYVRDKISQGIDDADHGRVVSNEEAKKRMEKWLK